MYSLFCAIHPPNDLEKEGVVRKTLLYFKNEFPDYNEPVLLNIARKFTYIRLKEMTNKEKKKKRRVTSSALKRLANIMS